MASAINPLTAGSTPTSQNSSSSSTATGSTPPSQAMFLQLLVAQIQNQDPLNPADGTQFVSELAQFSELEQVIAIRGDIETSQNTNAAAAPAQTSQQTQSTQGQTL